MSFNYKTLEFNIILEEISNYSHSKATSDEIKNLKPYFNKQIIIDEHNKTLEAMEILVKSGSLPFLDNFDIVEILQMIKSERELRISDLQYIRLFCVMGNQIIAKTKDFRKENIELNYLKSYFESIRSTNEVVDLIDSSIYYDGYIKDSASETLYRLRREINRTIKRRDEILQTALVKRRTILNDSILVMRNDRYCLPVKTEHKNQVKGIVHDVSSSGTTTYIEPIEASNLSNQLTIFQKDEENEIIRILAEISNELYPLYDDLMNNLDIFTGLDFYFSVASYANKYHCNAPEINDTGDVYLKNARHPLIDEDEVVPVTIKLSSTKPTLLITGPNTGGKTVGLKTLGLLSLMAQCGLLIPADEGSKTSIFNGIYADIGDQQSIKQSLSTFSSHIKNINNILVNAKPMSLILIDELGSGTDPNEGVSLAKSIINYLMKKDARLVVTTHYSELKVFAYSNPFIENASVRFDEETLQPLYIIDYGKSGSSNAIKIAKRLGVDDVITNEAQQYLNATHTNLDSSIIEFEKKHELLQQKIDSIEAKEQELKDKNKELEQRLALIESQKQTILERSKQEANKAIEELKLKAQIILEELKNVKSEPQVASLKYELRQLGLEMPEEDSKESFKKGDTVFIKSYQQIGEIIGIKNDQYLVQFGLFELYFDANNLTHSQKQQKSRTKQIKQEVMSPSKSLKIDVTNTLDLRGFRFEEVSEAYHSFIDQAIIGKLNEVKVIHGFGTGAVRKALYEELKHDRNIKSYRFGGEHEGLNGVTIITLKD